MDCRDDDPPDTAADSWPYYGHDAGGMRYSPLTQINRENVAQLKVVWTFHTGDVSEGGGAYDPKIDLDGDYGDGLVNRGVATWLDSKRGKDRPCRRRIFESTQDARLVAVDAATGAGCSDFGKSGEVSLRGVLQYDPG